MKGNMMRAALGAIFSIFRRPKGGYVNNPDSSFTIAHGKPFKPGTGTPVDWAIRAMRSVVASEPSGRIIGPCRGSMSQHRAAIKARRKRRIKANQVKARQRARGYKIHRHLAPRGVMELSILA